MGVAAEPLPLTAAADAQRLDVPLPGEVAYVHVDVQAGFFEQVMKEDSQRAARCRGFLSRLSGTQDAGLAAS